MAERLPFVPVRSDHMEDFVFALHAAAYRHVVEVHLSTLNGLHVIPAEERDCGNVFQATIRGRWENDSEHIQRA
jgi:hypothetical protein